MQNRYCVCLATAAFAVLLGCNSKDQAERLANEVNDLKVEVFRQRQEFQELAKKVEQEEKNAAAERARQNQFRANTQETLRQIREDVRTMSSRLTAPAATQRPSAPARPAAGQPPAVAAPPAESEPDRMQLVLAENDYNSGKYIAAADAADYLIKYFPDSALVPDALYTEGKALSAAKSFADAQKSFQRICDKHPESPLFKAAKLSIGRCQLNQNNTTAAIVTFQEVARLWPSSPEAKAANEILQDVQTGK
jgi:TolA-binding protein